MFYGKIFRDNEISMIYLYRKPVDIRKLTLQESEVSEVRWMDFARCYQAVREKTIKNCIYLDMIGKALGIHWEK